MHRITRQFIRVRDCTGSPFARCFDAGTFRVRGGKVLGLDCLHGAGVVRGSNQPESNQD